MAIRKTPCYVLRKIPLRETSWILTCMTRNHGKVKGIVKGARQEKSKWFSACELFTQANMVFFEKTRNNLHLISELSVVRSHETLRSHLVSLAYSNYIAELIDKLLEEGDPHPELFDLLGRTIRILEKNPDLAEMLVRVFEVKLLEGLGLMPRFSDCLECESTLEAKVYFNSAQGGVVCGDCFERFGQGFQISKGCLSALRFIMRTDLVSAIQVRLGIQIRKELEQVARQFIAFRIDQPIRSLKFISEVTPLISRK